MRKLSLALGVAAFALASCGQAEKAAEKVTDVATETASEVAATTVEKAKEVMASGVDSAKLSAILASQDDSAKARYPYRNPQETLEFFGVEPGMTIAEALPGGGWYSKILLPYIGDEGKLIGMDYSLEMWPHFGGFATAEFLAKKETWPTDWAADAAEWRGGSQAEITAFAFGNRDEALDGTVDMALFIRASHNLNRFADKGDYMGEALEDVHTLLKPDGILGVVQHRAPAGNSDEWADGSKGYLKQASLISTIEAAGFELVETSEINANPKDQPTESDLVWRLAPSFATSRNDAELKAKIETIGESDRMTLKFRKI